MKDLKVNRKVDAAVASTETVNIIAEQRTYKTRPFYVTPIYDAETRTYAGLNIFSKEDMEKANFIVKENESYMLQNGDRLLLPKDNKGQYILCRDLILYVIYSSVPEIALSRAEYKKGIHYFYLNNIERNAVIEVSKKRIVGKAYTKLSEASMKDMSDMLYYFGLTPLEYSAEVIESKAYGFADDSPQKVLDFFERRSVSDRLVFVNKLISHRLVSKDRNGYIMYDKVGLGNDVESAANFLYDERNDKIFSALAGALDVKEGHKNN